jgi:C1A family cysteine protease
MKLFVALGLFAVAFGTLIPTEVHLQFSEWRQKQGRTYVSAEDEQQHLWNFYMNYLEVAELNAAEAHLRNGAIFKLNHFADWSPAELTQLRGFQGDVVQEFASWPQAARLPLNAAPDEIDWRAKGVVSPIKNQASCGSCWAFATTSNVESVVAIATGSLTSLSEQVLVDCDHYCGHYRFIQGCDNGCGGGIMPNAMLYIIDNGQQSEDAYPYVGRNQNCRNSSIPPVAHIHDWTFIDDNEDQMTQWIGTKGPLVVGVDASRWSSYTGGIMSSTSICPDNDQVQNHAVDAVGYGTESGTPYWIIRNSWGTSWGEQGYARIIRGKRFCGVHRFALTSIH